VLTLKISDLGQEPLALGLGGALPPMTQAVEGFSLLAEAGLDGGGIGRERAGADLGGQLGCLC